MNLDRQLSTTFRVGRRFKCTMSMDASGGALKCEWAPKPQRGCPAKSSPTIGAGETR